GIHLAGRRVHPTVNAVLTGVPERAFAVEYERIEIGVGKFLRQREQLDLFGPGIDPRDGVLPTFGQPGIAISSDDDAMGRCARPERDLFKMTGLRIETAGKSLPLPADPDGAVRRRGDVVGIGAGRQLIERHLRSVRRLQRACREYQRRESEKADHGCLSILARPLPRSARRAILRRAAGHSPDGADLVSRFRSSHHCAAHLFANFGIKGTPAIYDSSAVFGFEVPTQTRGYNDRNFKSTALASQLIQPQRGRRPYRSSDRRARRRIAWHRPSLSQQHIRSASRTGRES